MVLEKNLYGMPNAARGWGKHRDDFILSYFNKGAWTCRRTKGDSCLFVIDKDTSYVEGSSSRESLPRQDRDALKCESAYAQDHVTSAIELPDHIIRSWVLIHTDDCDAYGRDMSVLHEINDIMNAEWQTEIASSEAVFGVGRAHTKLKAGLAQAPLRRNQEAVRPT